MTNEIQHPDKLRPGDCVGPWRILEVLGAGGMGRVFKVESEGKLYALKMAVRLPGERVPGEEDIDGRCVREASAMLERTPHPHVPRVLQVGRWPDADAGYLYLVMEFIDGWSFHDWRYEKHPSAAQLVDVLLPIARTLADLHKAGVHHRDIHAHNVLIRKEDGRPFVLDFGSVWLPGARTLTQGLPPVNLSAAPPEMFEHFRSQGDAARFEGGEMADLYAFGVLLYGALTDGYPFAPELPLEKLVAAITLRIPRAPRWLNPKVPRSLSDIAMRLLAKRPQDRFESAEALQRALWEANKERTSREWKVPLDLPESGPAPMTDEELHERNLEEEKARRAAQLCEQAADEASVTKDSMGAGDTAADSYMPVSAVAARRTKVIWTWERARRPVAAVLSCALVAGLVAVTAWRMGRPGAPPSVPPQSSALPAQVEPGGKVASPGESPEARAAAASAEAGPHPATIARRAMPPEDSTSVKTLVNVQPKPSTALRTARKWVGAAVTCSALTGCPGAQVRPAPRAEACPEGALDTMAKWGIKPGDNHLASFKPYEDAHFMTVSEGQATVLLIGEFKGLRGGEALSGRLIFADRVYGRLTEARVDGRTFPVCFELDDERGGRGLIREPNGSASSARVYSSVTVRAVREFD
jgi:serine/threonine-protein kinase